MTKNLPVFKTNCIPFTLTNRSNVWLLESEDNQAALISQDLFLKIWYPNLMHLETASFLSALPDVWKYKFGSWDYGQVQGPHINHILGEFGHASVNTNGFNHSSMLLLYIFMFRGLPKFLFKSFQSEKFLGIWSAAEYQSMFSLTLTFSFANDKI